MRYAPPLIALLLLLLHANAVGQNCNGSSTGRIPLTDLGQGTYQGFVAGLYPNGTNQRPAAHEAAGVQIAANLQPRDLAGNVDVQNGRIVLLSIGMSNTTQEFSTWLPISNADPQRSARVVVVDGAQGGQHAGVIVNPNAQFWTVIEQRLATAGVSVQQVGALWIKQAVAQPSGGFPAHATSLQSLLAEIVRITKQKYPNVALCYLSSRIYAGYATTTLNPEPYAYESGFAVKWLIEAQINGDTTLNFDAARGPVVAPWLAWGPYLWADGVVPRNDGLTWLCTDYQTARQKVANQLNAHFRSDTTTAPWYLGGGSVRAGILRYGVGCAGGQGALEQRFPTTPFLGNAAFEVLVGNAIPNAAAALLLGSARASLRLTPNCTLLVDPAGPVVTLPARTSAIGRAGFRFSVPNDVNLIGQTLPTQWLILDPQGETYGGVGIALSDGAEWRFGTP
jgi:hypothetical protein